MTKNAYHRTIATLYDKDGNEIDLVKDLVEDMYNVTVILEELAGLVVPLDKQMISAVSRWRERLNGYAEVMNQ